MNKSLNEIYLDLANRENGKDYHYMKYSEPKKFTLPKFIPWAVVILLGMILFSCNMQPAHAENYKLSKHFQSKELACHHCGECKVNMELIIALEKLRSAVNQPIIITSGYRCPIHNQAVGGAKNSQHKYGNAVDIKIKGYSPEQVANLAKECGFTWTKVYPNFTHIDIRKIQLARTK